jgi:uncharacterized membrane protein
MSLLLALHLLLAGLATALALALRPWRAVAADGPPWPWLAWWVVMPLLWGVDQFAQVPIIQPLSGACLLVLLAGWPLAVLGMLGVAVMTTLMADLSWMQGLERLVWQGLLPGSFAFALGQAIRRWLPHQLFVYILGRGFLASVVAGAAAGWLALAVLGTPPGADTGDVMIGRWLAAWGDAFLTGMFCAIFVALRPEWLATYSDRIYLLPPGR